MIQTDLGSLILIQITPKERTLYFAAGVGHARTRICATMSLNLQCNNLARQVKGKVLPVLPDLALSCMIILLIFNAMNSGVYVMKKKHISRK